MDTESYVYGDKVAGTLNPLLIPM